MNIVSGLSLSHWYSDSSDIRESLILPLTVIRVRGILKIVV
jgi:hypothetical protein